MKKMYAFSILCLPLAVTTSAHAALDAAKVTALETEVLADVATATGSGFTVFTVVIAASVGFALLSKFINKGANG